VDHFEVLDVGAALVMHHHVEPPGPVGVGVDGVDVLGALVGVVGDGPFDVGPRRDPFGEDVLLFLVVMATAADDQQGADGSGVRLGGGGGAGAGRDEQGQRQDG